MLKLVFTSAANPKSKVVPLLIPAATSYLSVITRLNLITRSRRSRDWVQCFVRNIETVRSTVRSAASTEAALWCIQHHIKRMLSRRVGGATFKPLQK